MALEKNELAATRERLEFLLEKDGNHRQQGSSLNTNAGSTRQAFIAGAAFSGLVAGSIFLTSFIDEKLREPEVASSVVSGVNNGASNNVKTISTTGISSGLGEVRTRVSPGVIPSTSFMNIPNTVSVLPNQTPIQPAHLVPVAGLSTSRSVITGVADAQTMTASYYWTFTLKNSNKTSKEAQMNIALPAGAVVSRATLWINGRAEEAAFNTTSQVQNAYDWIVTRNRDPLLITQTADGNINLKASPVMPNKEMKIRIGITTPMQMASNGQSKMELPHIIDANLDFNCAQNVHITSDVPLVSNDTRMNSPVQKHGFLLRGNVNAGDLQKLQVSAQRDPNLTKFATRATHSNPPSYIVAEVQQDAQGLRTLNLTKSIAKPDCPILNDDHAAFRMSYLWVKKEIERLASEQNTGQAEELATVYRVVSPVSGAVVLERQSDYDYNGLDRNMYKSLAYEPSRGVDDAAKSYANVESMQQPATELQRVAPHAAAPMPAAAPSAVPRPAPQASMDKMSASGDLMAISTRARRKAEHNSESIGSKGFSINNKIAMPVETKAGIRQKKTDAYAAEKEASIGGTMSEVQISVPSEHLAQSAQNVSQANDENKQSVRMAGPAATKLAALAVDANNLFLSKPITTAILLSLLGLTFSGGFILYAIAALRLCRRQSGAIKLAGCGAVWFAVAAVVPLFSQVFTVLLAAGLTLRAVLKTIQS